jgi:hypothetical protein
MSTVITGSGNTLFNSITFQCESFMHDIVFCFDQNIGNTDKWKERIFLNLKMVIPNARSWKHGSLSGK